MNVLVVDDQVAILNSLKKGVRWKELGFDEVFIATSAREARLILSTAMWMSFLLILKCRKRTDWSCFAGCDSVFRLW